MIIIPKLTSLLKKEIQMHCYREITKDLLWVGANDRRLAMFEGVYSVPAGVSYNSYLLLDEKTVLFDTVDASVSRTFLENITYLLGERTLDYLVVLHMEPDHSAVLQELITRYPSMKIVCNVKTQQMIEKFYQADLKDKAYLVNEGDTLSTGVHSFAFYMAPMVHWPEVMVAYDSHDKILFSADAFGCFGALNGALFADEVDFNRDYLDEARRYYTNIVGKYGPQVAALLKKASGLDIQMIAPLHGFVWRKNFTDILTKYTLWSQYTPEEEGVLIVYASIYGNTENAAEILAVKLREAGAKVEMFDVSVTPASEIISAAFRWSHIVFASSTYNAGIFVSMEAFVHDLVAHNIQNRVVAIIENGSWAPASGELLRQELNKCKNMTILEPILSLQSSLKETQLADIQAMAQALLETFAAPKQLSQNTDNAVLQNSIDANTMFHLSYGLFVLTAKDGDKDNGCIINTTVQLTSNPIRLTIAVNKANYTHDMILKTKEFNVSILTVNAPFQVFQQFGFSSGKDTDKFEGCGYNNRTENGIRYLPEYTNGVISAHVVDSFDYGTHTLFVAEVTQAVSLSKEKSVTYEYYFANIKPKPAPTLTAEKKGFVCKICGYVHEGDTLPDDFICPLCKHGAADFEPL
jgi:flavorubredoxin/flavin reductase (DIM6/NTAB) family NADH-FMN oxidoreductase RutF/rubredoxin